MIESHGDPQPRNSFSNHPEIQPVNIHVYYLYLRCYIVLWQVKKILDSPEKSMYV